MSQTPHKWNQAALGDVCRIVSGATPKTAVLSFWGGDVNWVTPMDLSRDPSKTIMAGARSLTRDGLNSCGATIFPAGSVIVSSRAPVGYVAIAGADMCTSQGCKTAVPPEEISSDYLYWYLVGARADLVARASGTTFKELSGKRFSETRISWPDIAEQRRIVGLIEDHITRLDRVDRAVHSARRKLAALIQSWMLRKMTVPVSDLTTVGRALVNARGGWSRSRSHLVDAAEGVPYLKMNNISRSGRLDLESLVYVRASEADVDKYGVKAGDVLFNSKNSGDLVGKTAVADKRVEGAVLNENIMRLRFGQEVEPAFAALWFRAPTMRKAILSAASASTNVVAVYQRELLRMPMWLPELSTQRELVSEFNELSAHAFRLSAALSATETRARVTRSSILFAAFSGRLTGAVSDIERVEELAHA